MLMHDQTLLFFCWQSDSLLVMQVYCVEEDMDKVAGLIESVKHLELNVECQYVTSFVHCLFVTVCACT